MQQLYFISAFFFGQFSGQKCVFGAQAVFFYIICYIKKNKISKEFDWFLFILCFNFTFVYILLIVFRPKMYVWRAGCFCIDLPFSLWAVSWVAWGGVPGCSCLDFGKGGALCCNCVYEPYFFSAFE